ncbi:MAG: (2Fe-2S)-binding protein [Alphaproteobacteria bacterium]|nr:(2Fe-2S)-binding protein [Alphaproteobacteria bacterium]
MRTTCPYCGVGCGVIIDQGTIKGDPQLTSTAQISAFVRAGSSCGSCVPELEQILRDHRATAA